MNSKKGKSSMGKPVFERPIRNMVCAALCAATLSACQTGQFTRIGDLVVNDDHIQEQEIDKVTYEEIREEYRKIAERAEDEQLKEQIDRRVSTMYMLEGEKTHLNNPQRADHYADAIISYTAILKRYPSSPDNAEIYYQLAKAYDFQGDQRMALEMLSELVTRYPNYPNILEARFRKADIHFNLAEYAQARSQYLSILGSGSETFQLNVQYMLAWVYYKERQYLPSIDAFSSVLDNLLATTATPEDLPQDRKVIFDDGLRSMILALHHVGGAEQIDELPNLKRKPYLWVIYDKLGDYFLEKELFEKSADTYRSFITRYKASEHAPKMHKKIIDAYLAGDFQEYAMLEKAEYVEAYGYRNKARYSESGLPEYVAKQVALYLDELARFHYRKGQSYANQLPKPNKEGASPKLTSLQKEIRGEMIVEYTRAAQYYDDLLTNIPNVKDAHEKRYLLAEAYFSSLQYELASIIYQQIAFDEKIPKGTKLKANYKADAGYAAIISLRKHIAKLEEDLSPETEIKTYQIKSVEVMLLFARTFDRDKRSPAVLANAADYLFGLGEYQRAADMVTELLLNQPNLNIQVQIAAYDIKAHSHFKLEQYDKAAESYLGHRALLNRKDKVYKELSDKIAVSLYKQHEQLLKDVGKEAAAGVLLKVKDLAPEAAARVTMQYDAATYYLELEKWSVAIQQLAELDKKFPKHELAVEFPRKLALAYEREGDIKRAVATYLRLSNSDPDPDIKREALFTAALLEEKNGNTQAAITHFRTYANIYSEPLDNVMEARFHLAKNYTIRQQFDKQIFWLNKLIEGNANAGSEATERTRWLASWAYIQKGEQTRKQFEQVALGHPIANSLPRKMELFQKALESYEAAAKMGSLDQLTESSYRMGLLHEEFARSIIKSKRPPGLSKAESNEYSMILKQQADPLLAVAKELHLSNIERAWEGEFSKWINNSFESMRAISPERFSKKEMIVTYGEGLL